MKGLIQQTTKYALNDDVRRRKALSNAPLFEWAMHRHDDEVCLKF